MMAHDLSDALLVKCQATGPVTFGMQVRMRRRPILYDRSTRPAWKTPGSAGAVV